MRQKGGYIRKYRIRSFRLTLGQPRQEELVDSLRNEKLKAEDLERLYMDLSPWRRRQEKLTAECESVKI